MGLRLEIEGRPVSVRFLRLTDGRARGAADGRADRSGHDSAGDCAGGGLLFDGVAAGGETTRGQGRGEDDGEAFHDWLLDGSSENATTAKVFRNRPIKITSCYRTSFGQ